MSKETTLSIDWISTTSHKKESHIHYSSYPALHDWDNWNHTTGRLGYEIGAKHTTGVVALLSLVRPDMGVHTIYSGKSLQRIAHMFATSGIDILKYHIQQGHNIARLDIALDFINHGLSVQNFVDEWYAKRVETKLRACNIVKSLDNDSYTMYIGSQKTRKKLVRIYNKSAEQGLDINWVRVEAQLMGKPATKTGIIISGEEDTEHMMLRCLKDVVNFPFVKSWSDVMEGLTEVRIGSHNDEKGDTREWLLNSVIPSLSREIVLDTSFWVQFTYMVSKEVNRLRSEK